MKVTKEKLNQIIQEELASLVKEDEEIAAALMGKAGLPRSAQDTKVDKPITPKDLGPEDEPYTERETVDIGDAPPTREFIIKAAEMLNIVPSNKSDENVIYNVAMYLQNIGGNEIDAVVADARAEAEYIKADEPLEENKMKLTKAKLQQIIKEEFEKVVKEYGAPVFSPKKEKSQYARRMPAAEEDDRTELEKATSKDKNLKEKDDKWIQKAVPKDDPDRGKFSAAAKKAGMSTCAYARKIVKSDSASKLQKDRAQFALNTGCKDK
tara:strand:+ start:55 stop:852 length:798 start_codon:yes stop_codon:yes gene_type:complete